MYVYACIYLSAYIMRYETMCILYILSNHKNHNIRKINVIQFNSTLHITLYNFYLLHDIHSTIPYHSKSINELALIFED